MSQSRFPMKSSDGKHDQVGRDGAMATQAIVQQLQKRIERIETSARVDDGQTVSSGCTAVDQLLPEGGYRRGILVEWVSTGLSFSSQPDSFKPLDKRLSTKTLQNGKRKSGRLSRRNRFSPGNGEDVERLRQSVRCFKSSGGCGADYLSLLTAANACADGGALVVADRHRMFYPPAAAATGIDLGNVIVIRPPQEKASHDQRYDDEFFWAIDQALGCSAVAAVWGAIDHVGERWFRRFQLSAEASGTMGLFVRPASAIGQPGWSEIQWHVTPRQSPVSHAAVQCVDLKLARCRGGRSGESIGVQVDTVTGTVSETTAMLPKAAALKKHVVMGCHIQSRDSGSQSFESEVMAS